MQLDYRIFVIAANVLANQLGIPVPAIPTLVVAGALTAQGQLSGSQLFAAAVAACVLADSAWFLAGRIYGNGVMKVLCRISLTPDSCVSDTQARFEKWGANALLVAKFVPGLALIAPPLAGATRMAWLRFLMFSSLGASAWVGVTVLGGMLFRRQIELILPHLAEYGARAGILIGTLLVLYIAYKWWQRMRFYSVLRMARIDVAELHRMLGEGVAPLVVDVRSPTAFTLDPRRIPGALHIPLNNMSEHLKDLPRDREIIAYCSCPNEASAAQVAKLLMDNGFRRVRPLHGGLDAWIAAGYPADVISLTAERPPTPALVAKG